MEKLNYSFIKPPFELYRRVSEYGFYGYSMQLEYTDIEINFNGSKFGFSEYTKGVKALIMELQKSIEPK